ncbi:eukaryotic initiation factor 4a, putative [Bodo saltans]|uniref:ATP-dependent RNA helicase n=1 Tax=Bodo saltans TaxID=75058 RepID=A0A0S4INB3_BODSA|nr:eukaryotic initiation factor 4a, putative [Bodo saltans]|eukprot:CUE77022.1 eukaryotic initiation factor 4a, putative [Bodo saltans]
MSQPMSSHTTAAFPSWRRLVRGPTLEESDCKDEHRNEECRTSNPIDEAVSLVSHSEVVADRHTSATTTLFDDMDLHENLLRGIYAHGFETPSRVQQDAIPPIVQGCNVILQSSSGTGKSFAYIIGMLQRIDVDKDRRLQALVLVPTRELALQIGSNVAHIGEFVNNTAPAENFVQVFVGGLSVSADAKKLKSGCVIVIGTLGRIADLMKRGALQTQALRVVVIDEADNLLLFRLPEELHQLFSRRQQNSQELQFVLSSTTISTATLEKARKFVTDPIRILVPRRNLSPEGIKQFFVSVDEENKLLTLCDLYESITIAQTVIFTNTSCKAEWIAEQLNTFNCTASMMHADMQQSERDAVMSAFRAGCSRVLVTTDMFARGLDIVHVIIVVNYDLPTSGKDPAYVHRIGRCGRYGRKGITINFVSPEDVALHKEIEEHWGIVIDELPMDFPAYLA